LTVQLAFLFHSQDAGYGDDTSWGWYIDDVLIAGMTATQLSTFSASLRGDGIEISWELTEAGDRVEFSIIRENLSSGARDALSPAPLQRERLSFTYVDDTCEPGGTYRYQVFVADEEGRRLLFETDAVTAAPLVTSLHGNYPNPFNPSTTIRYEIGRACPVSLKVFDLKGALVRVLYEGDREAGRYTAMWDGFNESGNQVSSGIYLYRLKARGFENTRKLILLR
jgi:hypothetical protein